MIPFWVKVEKQVEQEDEDRKEAAAPAFDGHPLC
jgi:hypothetical protein